MNDTADANRTFHRIHAETEGFDPTQDIQWLMTSEEVAEWLGRTVEYVETLAEEGRIPARRLRGSWRYGYASLNLWIEGRTLGELVKEAIRKLMVDAQEGHNIAVDGDEFGFEIDPLVTMETLERAYIQYVLREKKDNKTLAADTLGMDPSTLYRKIKRYGL